MNTFLLITCEHGGNKIPGAYRHAFDGHGPALESHRGWDPGALQLARHCARRFKAPLKSSSISRLLVELNRSPGHPQHLSEMTRRLTADVRQRIVARYYKPYRDKVEAAVLHAAHRGDMVIHLSVHSFTPVLDGVVRDADIGILFDQHSVLESAFCARWKQEFERASAYRVRLNYPYNGADDGLTTYLRTVAPANFAGIELEVNQRYPLDAPAKVWRKLRQDVVDTLRAALCVLSC